MSLIGSVLLPHDGSPLADSTLPYAVELVRITGASLELLRVLEELKPIYDSGLRTLVWIDPAHPRAELVASEVLGPVVEKLMDQGLAAKTIVRVGDPRSEILDEAETLANPLILLASHGRSGLSRFVFGSVATRVLQTSQNPVMIVRAREAEEQPEAVSLKHIMVLLDGSDLSEKALPYAAELARDSGGQLHLVRVAETYRDELPDKPPHIFTAPSYQAMLEHFDELERQARDYLAGVATRLEGELLSVTSEVLSGDPFREIGKCSEREQPDLIVMTTHGRSGIARWFYGSVADRILTSTSTPVLLVRSGIATS
ncbi:MAG TPA: universal stress protein [Nitrolancea sp.]|nr:universal stress protein [Nitrolancea sp.]